MRTETYVSSKYRTDLTGNSHVFKNTIPSVYSKQLQNQL